MIDVKNLIYIIYIYILTNFHIVSKKCGKMITMISAVCRNNPKKISSDVNCQMASYHDYSNLRIRGCHNSKNPESMNRKFHCFMRKKESIPLQKKKNIFFLNQPAEAGL